MEFSDRLKKIRIKNNLTQKELAEMVKISPRTISRYETGESFPRDKELLQKLQMALSCSSQDLLTPEESFVLNAGSDFGKSGLKDAEELVNGVIGLMAGGELPKEDKKAILDAIQEAYYLVRNEES